MQTEQIKKKRWRELRPIQRAGIVISTVIQIALLAAALWDIRRRPAAEIRGSKAMWSALVFINYIGPIAYFIVGRKLQPRNSDSGDEE